MSIFSAQQIADAAVARYTERHPEVAADHADPCGYSVYDMLWEQWSAQPEPEEPVSEESELRAFAAWVDGQ